jgi:tRNA threonylcarbamoyl adenosine modification protein YeaZ
VIRSSEVIETGSVETRALSMVEEALSRAQLEREELDCLALGLGPGSYNGIRAALSLAQGWQLARGTRLLGISSAECIAAQAQLDGIAGQVAVVIDAQRGEFYLAEYEIAAEQRRAVRPLRLATMAEVQASEAAGARIAGPEVLNWFSAGKLVFPRAELLGRLALGHTDFVSGDQLQPIYLRETTFVKAPAPRRIPG